MAALPSAVSIGLSAFTCQCSKMWEVGGGVVWRVEMQEWGFMHAQIKVYLGSIRGSSKG